jgi:hypothetical protein
LESLAGMAAIDLAPLMRGAPVNDAVRQHRFRASGTMAHLPFLAETTDGFTQSDGQGSDGLKALLTAVGQLAVVLDGRP